MYYVLDENNNKVPAYDKEGVLAVIEEAIANGSLAGLVADAAFVTKIKCCVSGQANKIAFVTQAKYNELAANGAVEQGVYYYITDDVSDHDILAAVNTAMEHYQAIVNGEAAATEATHASTVGINEGVYTYERGLTEDLGNALQDNGTYILRFTGAVNGVTLLYVSHNHNDFVSPTGLINSKYNCTYYGNEVDDVLKDFKNRIGIHLLDGGFAGGSGHMFVTRIM